MTAVAIWRALGGSDARRRSLWGCFLGFSIALWTKTEVVRIGLNNSSITDASVLLKHYSAGAAILAIMYYIVAVYGHGPADGEMARAVRVSRVIQRAATKTALASFALMTIMFFTIVDRSIPSDHFVSDHAGQWGATAYMTVFYIYLGSASAICLYQWAGAFRREERSLLRVGLGMMASAMVLGVTYSFGRMVAMWIWLAVHPSTEVAHKVETSTEAMQLLLFVLFALGVSVPASEKGLRRARAWLSLARLYPMWRELMAAFPAIPMEPPRSRYHELTRREMDAELRLDRWIHDVADAIEKLRHHVPDGLMAAAKTKTARSSVAQAYWIKAALAAKASGVPAGSVAAFEQPAATDQAGEVAWLRQVARAYKKSNVAQVESLLAVAGATA
ncbi:MAB_1171c family putative transporter [Streptomyces sp. NRRL S-920]|uniref:MAB_1171c family putative transporter n=1 Tax=Streptomyces sp. NRRL S-920 TaxID=1463921 RepID=UPI0006896D16|nr:MAB_1171c family putative transporter [Streptomyces sp. NRRL S-920]